MMNEPQLSAYRAARNGTAFADSSASGWLRLTGHDRMDLLHRISTNDLKKLQPGQGAPTVFTNAMGRVMAFLTVYAGEDEVFVRTQPKQAPGVTRYLKSMIFWQDQVEVADLTTETAQFVLYGPQSGAILRSWGVEAIADLPPYGWTTASVAGATVSVHQGGPLESFTWSLLTAANARQAVLEALAPALPQLDDETVDLLRIEAGLPLLDRELTEQVTPLETGLLPAISFTKGCYTGQEVIARQTNYDKVTRNLVGLEFPEQQTRFLAETWFGNSAGGADAVAHVSGPGRGGFVGSAAYSPMLDKVIALAVVPRELAQPGTEVEVVRGHDTITATVRSLPFIPKW